ncbi:hypothetical protein BLOT_005944 [Blomia tropicalis]|nr:hypothetical protein BLOT_005944 [Blomia tropicalis]
MGMNPNNLCYERVQQQNEIFKQNHLQPNRDFMVNRICRTNRQSRPRTRPSFNTRQDYWFDDTKVKFAFIIENNLTVINRCGEFYICWALSRFWGGMPKFYESFQC